MREELLKVLAKTDDHGNIIFSALNYVENVTGKRINGCAATASNFLVTAGIMDHMVLMTGDVRDFLRQHLCEKITDPSQVIIGDVCFTKDLAPRPNGFPDHVFIIATDKYGGPKSYARYIVDNYAPGIHKRNLMTGPRTEFDYAYRLPLDQNELSVDKLRCKAISDLGDIYDNLKGMKLPEAEETYILQRLNEIRFSNTLKGYKRG